jgi:hypothetical protein
VSAAELSAELTELEQRIGALDAKLRRTTSAPLVVALERQLGGLRDEHRICLDRLAQAELQEMRDASPVAPQAVPRRWMGTCFGAHVGLRNDPFSYPKNRRFSQCN